MKMSKERIAHLTVSLTDRLEDKGLLEIVGSKSSLVQKLERAIADELSVEDRLNVEIRELLKQYDAEFESNRADYQKMFSMVKSKLIKERGLIL